MFDINSKPKLKLLFGSLIVLSFLFLGFNNASAVGNASFPQDTTINLSSSGTNYTVVGGSDADSVVVNANNFVVTISSGRTFTVTSTNKYQFDNNQGYGSTCDSTKSTLVLTSSTSKVVTVTPNVNIILCSSGSGNPGGGGGGGVVLTTPTPTPSITVTPTPSTSVTPTPVVSATPTASFTPGLVLHKLLRTSRGSKVYAQSADGTWHWIRTLAEFNAGGYSWSDLKVVSATAFAKLAVLSKITVKKGTKWVNVRVSPSTKGKVIGKFLNGNEFDKLGYNNGWYQINLPDGQTGWVSGTVVNEN